MGRRPDLTHFRQAHRGPQAGPAQPSLLFSWTKSGQPIEEKGWPSPVHGLPYIWARLGQPAGQDGSAH
ncbi:hypothetical protein TorRG33x02_264250, partial [Trema orientale]